MKRAVCSWRLMGLAAGVAALSPAVELAAAPVQSAPEAASGGRVLVMLRLAPPHFRAGSDYGGSYGDGIGRAARRRIATIIARGNGLVLVDDWPMPLLGLDCFVMAVPTGLSTETVAAALSDLPGVAWAQPVNSFAGQAGRPDPLFAAQPAAVGWHLGDLHKVVDGSGVKVAIIDSAVERSHPDLAGQVPVGMNFVAGQADGAERHGTAVAGIIGAIADNGIGIAGIAPRARLMSLRACWQTATATLCDSFSLAKALHFAVSKRVDVINLSLGGQLDPLLARLLDLALAHGTTVVAAYDRNRDDGGFPASYRGVVAVADAAASALPDGIFSAPGNAIPTTRSGGSWTLVDGSSYAAAQVTGLVALMRSVRASSRKHPTLVSVPGKSGAIDSCASVLGPMARCGPAPRPTVP